MSPGREIGISDLPTEILKENISAYHSGQWDQILKNKIQNDINNNIDSLFNIYVQKIEKLLIETVLETCNGRKIQAAKILGLGRNTISRKIKDYNIT